MNSIDPSPTFDALKQGEDEENAASKQDSALVEGEQSPDDGTLMMSGKGTC